MAAWRYFWRSFRSPGRRNRITTASIFSLPLQRRSRLRRNRVPGSLRRRPAPQASPGLRAAKAVTSNEAEIPLPKKTRFFRELKAKEDFNPVMSASQKIPAPPPASAPASPSSARAAVASSDSGMSLEAVAANLPNFPFPWYLARVRSNLFTQWAQKNQDLPLECLISFVIRRDGSISLVKVKRSSGNRYFDYDAVSSVEQSAPFPPLPEALPDPDLRVHVNFKALSRSSS